MLVIKQLHLALFSLRGTIKNSTRNTPILYEKKDYPLREINQKVILYNKEKISHETLN